MHRLPGSHLVAWNLFRSPETLTPLFDVCHPNHFNYLDCKPVQQIISQCIGRLDHIRLLEFLITWSFSHSETYYSLLELWFKLTMTEFAKVESTLVPNIGRSTYFTSLPYIGFFSASCPSDALSPFGSIPVRPFASPKTCSSSSLYLRCIEPVGSLPCHSSRSLAPFVKDSLSSILLVLSNFSDIPYHPLPYSIGPWSIRYLPIYSPKSLHTRIHILIAQQGLI